MKFMTIYNDIPEALDELRKMIGQKRYGATAKYICRIPTYYDDDNSFAGYVLGLCYEGSFLSYLKNKRACRKDPQWFVKGWI